MDRECNKCVYSTRDGNCRKWDCEYKTVEDIRTEVIDEFENKILGNCSVMLKDGERVIVIRQDIFKFVRDELKEK